MIKLDITSKKTNLTIQFLVEYIMVLDEVLVFSQNGVSHRYNLENYIFTINDNA